jgi:hypothetical protein
MNRIVTASLPLALFVFVTVQAGGAKASPLTDRKLELIRAGTSVPPSVAPSLGTPGGAPLRVAKHLRGQGADPAAEGPSGPPNLSAAKRRVRLG